MTAIKAIETRYNGYRFRSRLEARWALYFDTIGLVYEYEKEGFHLDGLNYLPDFWFPEKETWGEVKPIDFTDLESEKARRLVVATQQNFVRLIGPPAVKSYDWNYPLHVSASFDSIGFVVKNLKLFFVAVPTYEEIEVAAAKFALDTAWCTGDRVFISRERDIELEAPWLNDIGTGFGRSGLPPADVPLGVAAARAARFDS